MTARIANPDAGLVDPFGRRIDYVRLSVTDRCNLRCFYCLPRGFRGFEEPAHWLDFDEITRVIRLFTELGVSRVRLTGGEPLVRKGVLRLIERLASLPRLDDLSMSTNALRLGESATAIRDAGVGRINVSLDTLRPDRFAEITGGGDLDLVLTGLMSARDAGLQPIKINMVAMRGVNDDEFGDMVRFCMQHGFTLRFIETMPVGTPGRNASSHYLDLDGVRRELQAEFDLIPGCMPGGGPARYYQVRGTDFRLGFITPISQHFCETCNRVRLAVDGTLYLCLGHEQRVELRPLLRDGIDDDSLRQVLVEALALKPERHDFRERPDRVTRCMSLTGG